MRLVHSFQTRSLTALPERGLLMFKSEKSGGNLGEPGLAMEEEKG